MLTSCFPAGHRYRLSKKRLAKDKGHPEQSGDAEKNPPGNGIFPDHFRELMPTTEPLRSLQQHELRLERRIRYLEMEKEDDVEFTQRRGSFWRRAET